MTDSEHHRDEPAPSCATCRFNHRHYIDKESGYIFSYCRRYAPTRDGWPGVDQASWCGEYEKSLTPATPGQ